MNIVKNIFKYDCNNVEEIIYLAGDLFVEIGRWRERPSAREYN